MSKKKISPCAYCGINSGIDREHVIPKLLFEKPYPENFITVPACRRCNIEKQKDDEYLREYLLANKWTSNHVAAIQLRSGRIARGIQKGYKYPLLESVVKSQKSIVINDKFGNFIDKNIATHVEDIRMFRLIKRITYGLHYKRFGTLLAQGTTFNIFTFNEPSKKRILDSWSSSGHDPLFTIGSTEFQCVRWNMEGAAKGNVWMLGFYFGLYFFVIYPALDTWSTDNLIRLPDQES